MNPNPARNEIVVCQPDDAIQSRILTLRGVQVLLDRDLAMLFGVPTKVLNQAVKRNANRFPERFMFRLTNGENAGLRSRSVTSNATSAPTGEIAFGGSGGDESLLRSQIVTSKAGTRPDSSGRGGSRYLPHAFTEHGVAVEIVTSPNGRVAASDVAKFNAQYPTLSVRVSGKFHDRFLILDDKELYHVGASLKDLGRKCFAFSTMDPSLVPAIKSRL